MEKLDIQYDLQYAEVVSSVREIDGQSIMNIDVESFFDGDDVIVIFQTVLDTFVSYYFILAQCCNMV